jgi:hypothetical protein
MGFEAPRTKALQHRSGMQYGAARAAHGGADAHTTDKVQRSANRQDLRIGTAPCELKVKDGPSEPRTGLVTLPPPLSLPFAGSTKTTRPASGMAVFGAGGSSAAGGVIPQFA